MRHVSHKTRIAIILEHVDAWRTANNWSRETVCEHIVEAHYKFGFDKLTQVNFDRTGDLATIWKNNADRIYRWLDDKSKDRNFLCSNFEDSILAAMPADRRMALLNDIYSKFDLVVRGAEEKQTDTFNATAHLVNVARETSEATAAMASLVDGVTPAKLASADKELSEAEEALRAAHAELRAQLH